MGRSRRISIYEHLEIRMICSPSPQPPPKGEGWGEGDRDARIPKTISRKRPTAQKLRCTRAVSAGHLGILQEPRSCNTHPMRATKNL